MMTLKGVLVGVFDGQPDSLGDCLQKEGSEFQNPIALEGNGSGALAGSATLYWNGNNLLADLLVTDHIGQYVQYFYPHIVGSVLEKRAGTVPNTWLITRCIIRSVGFTARHADPRIPLVGNAVGKCECGSFKAMGIGRSQRGHSSWCPWAP